MIGGVGSRQDTGFSNGMISPRGQQLTECAPPQITAGERAACYTQVEMSWLLSIWNGGAAGERLIAKSGLPVSGDDDLGAIQELGAEQESPGKIGAVEHRFEEVCPLQAGTR